MIYERVVDSHLKADASFRVPSSCFIPNVIQYTHRENESNKLQRNKLEFTYELIGNFVEK
jgi:hypothetical protein